MDDSRSSAGPWVRRFAVFTGSQALSLLGSGITVFACTVWLSQARFPGPEQKAALAGALTALAAALVVPRVLFAAVGGTLADRGDRRRILVSVNLASGLLSLTLLWVMLRGSLDLPLLVGMAALSAALDTFHRTASESSLALLVPAPHLARANGVEDTMAAIANVLAPAAAGLLIALPRDAARQVLAGLPLAIAADALTFFVAAAGLATVPIPRAPTAAASAADPPAAGLVAEAREALRYLRGRPSFLWLLAVVSVSFLCSPPLHLMLPLIVKFNLGAGAEAGTTFESALAWVQALAGAGSVVGGLLVSLGGGARRRMVPVLLGALLLDGASVCLLGLSGHLAAAAAFAFLWGLAAPLAVTHDYALWQTHTPPAMQGRLLSARRTLTQICWAVGAGVAGAACARWDPGRVAAIYGGVLAATALSQLFNRRLMALEAER
ncbi:MAG TPA: MFS transporter [Myxococcaceae bacterium]|jgi:hypothetical protein